MMVHTLLETTGEQPRVEARPERTSMAFLMLCAWNNVDPKDAPPDWWSHPSDANRLAWERVAKAALAWLTLDRISDGEELRSDGAPTRHVDADEPNGTHP
jgi:hypothetical protein